MKFFEVIYKHLFPEEKYYELEIEKDLGDYIIVKFKDGDEKTV